MSIQAIRSLNYQTPPMTPKHSFVEININGVNAAEPQRQTVAEPVHSDIPKSSIYEMPQKSIYELPNANMPAAVQEVPIVPPPVIITPNIVQTNEPATPVATPVAVSNATPAFKRKAETAAAPQKVEVKASETLKPQLDLNEFISKLTSPDYEKQVEGMADISIMIEESPEKAQELLDVKIATALLDIINKDSSKLEGPTPKQLQIREKIMNGEKVTDAEYAEADKVTPMELAERNKMLAIYLLPALQKLYISETEKMINAIVPITELPGAAVIVEQLKSNPNPLVKIACIEALDDIKRPEYKQDLTAVLTAAKNDENVYVQKAVELALEKLGKVSDPTPPALTEQQKAA